MHVVNAKLAGGHRERTKPDITVWALSVRFLGGHQMWLRVVGILRASNALTQVLIAHDEYQSPPCYTKDICETSPETPG